MELGENNNTTQPPLIPYSKRRSIHGCVSSMGSSLTASVLGTWVLFPGARLQAQEGRKPPPRGFYRNNASAFVVVTLFCSVTALDEMGFIPGNRKDILELSWFGKCRACRAAAAEGEVEALPAVGSSPCWSVLLPHHQHLLVKLLQHRTTNLHFEDILSCRDLNPC